MELTPPPPLPDTPEDLPADLQAVARRYARQPVPQPTAADTARLLARLLVEEPAARAASGADRPRGHVARALRVARWRVRLLGVPFWLASAVTLALAVAVGAPLRAGGLDAWQALVLLVPLTAVLGLAHALRTPHVGLREVEGSCPIGAAEALAGVVLAIVGFDCALGLAATLALALAGWAPFVALAAAWLGPLLLLSGLSLPVALRWGVGPAALVGVVPWLLAAAVTRLQPVGPFALPGDTPAGLARLAAAGVGGLLLLLTLRTAPARPSGAALAPRQL